MSEDRIYLEIAQRYLESCEQHIANGINIQEVIGFKCYHAFESIAGAYNSHAGNKISSNHSKKINMFVSNVRHDQHVNPRSITALAMTLSSVRNKYLYPDKIGAYLKCPKDQLSITDAKKLVRRVKGVLRDVEKLI